MGYILKRLLAKMTGSEILCMGGCFFPNVLNLKFSELEEAFSKYLDG